MPDPRVNIVKPCPPSYLPKAAADLSLSTSSRRTFFDAAGKIGNLNVLNSVGGGKVGQGLRTLSKISNTIRSGCGSLPTSIGGALGAGADATSSTITAGSDWVLQQMGLSTTTADAVRAFNPQIANQATGQAKQLFDQVRRGHFKTSDIPGYLQDFQNLERLGRNIFTPFGGDRNNAIQPRCEASPYAVDLIMRAPKHKFMFIVQFVPNGGYETIRNLDAAFTVQNSTRPNIHYQTEDVNYYNYRTKVITKTEFEPMSMKFYDDIRDQSGMFYAAILKAMTPAANFESAAGFNSLGDEGGMDFAPENPQAETGGNPNRPHITGVDFTNMRYKASTGLLLNDNKTIFQEIILYHLYDGGRAMDVFHFYNPRFTDLKLDELAMSESAATMLELGFVYDTVFVETSVAFSDINNISKSAQDASSGGGHAFYSLKPHESAAAQTGPNTLTTPDSSAATSASSTTDSCGNAINTNNPTTPPAEQPELLGGGG